MTESDSSVIEEILEDIGAEHDAWIELTRRSSSEELMKRPANGWTRIARGGWSRQLSGATRFTEGCSRHSTICPKRGSLGGKGLGEPDSGIGARQSSYRAIIGAR